MKKSFVLFVVLVVFAVSVVCFGQVSILEEKEKVQITEHVLFGDKSIVEGVALHMKTTYEEQLFWDTTYVIGEKPKVNTDYTFYQQRQNYYTNQRMGSIYFHEDISHEFGWMQENSQQELEGMELAGQELYDSLGPSEAGERTIFLKDYIDYYHFGVNIEGPYDTGFSNKQMCFIMQESELERELIEGKAKNHDVEGIQKRLEWLETFHEFFKIPVMENDVSIIAMEKNEKGEVIGWGMSTVTGGSSTGEVDIPDIPDLEKYDSFRFDTRYSVTDGDAYFTFDTHSFHGKVVDTSHIPGGYGIYHFPYDVDKEEIYPEQLQMVYALDPNTRVYDLTRDASGENLLLFTTEEDLVYMSIIDIASMTLVDKVEVSTSEYGIDHYQVFEDYMVINGEKLVVFTIDENGTYEKAFAASKEQIEALNIDETGMTQIPEAGTCYEWDGEKLLFANYMYNHNGYLSTSFYVGVAGEEGLLYFAVYDSSLQSTNSKDLNGYFMDNYFHCRPVNEDAMSISW